ncbi:MAG: ATP-grasp domain-containing protein [Actinomycetota bacterium]|nr:ATP-grasp domain-containing protein [Actinomycetota bacterium]
MNTARAMDITTVAVFSDPDANSLHVRIADESVALSGNSASDTYLRAELIIAAALRSGCDAIHPGYGFLAENAQFARACAEAGLIFVGPSPETIDAMGSKIAAREVMASAGVPVLPGISVDDLGDLPADLAARAAGEVGFPLLVKATYGGGGRGMRIVRDGTELYDAVMGARREAASAFGNGSVLLEHYLDSPRHIEVQVFGDSHGNVVHLFERECSIQRRYQKIIEEAPSPVVTESMRAELGEAAVTAAKAIGYLGAGTVEFVMDADGRFFFLEVNTRLQVEHPVTELVTGLDLVKLQLLVAEGRELPEEVLKASINGHAIEARLYAEDVTSGFVPVAGTVHRFRVPKIPGIRVDTGIADGSEVAIYYDPMLAKVIAHGATRDEARRTLARALYETRLHGVTSNRELLVAILREAEFSSGEIDTGYLGRHHPAHLIDSAHNPEASGVLTLAAALAAQAERRRDALVLGTLPSGWRNVFNAPQRVTFSSGGRQVEVAYQLCKTGLEAEVDGLAAVGVRLYSVQPAQVDIEVAGVRQQIDVHRVGDVLYVDGAVGSTVLAEVPRFPALRSIEAPGSLLAPLPGTVVRVAVEAGQSVLTGATVVVIEAMKMEHTVKAPRDGIVQDVCVVVGQAVDAGLALVRLEEGI